MPLVTRHSIVNITDIEVELMLSVPIAVEVDGSNLSGVFLSRLLRRHVSSSRSGMISMNNSSVGDSEGSLGEERLDALGVERESEDGTWSISSSS